ncbi:MAG: DUF2142 domain-containing protein [Methanobrevibacter sp.]|nr:DUF2142 domain-containing protein [Methanobrevibacter sp.]
MLGKCYDLLNENKKFIFLYILFIAILTIEFHFANHVKSVEFEVVSFILIAILSIFFIIYYSRNKDSLAKVGFMFILVYGLIFIFITPPFAIPDEAVHLYRVETILQGHLVPLKTELGYPFVTHINPLLNYLLPTFKAANPGIGPLLTNNTQAFAPISSHPINYTLPKITTTPFYSYIFSAVGVYIAMLLDLGAIWVVWISRIVNLIIYSAAVYIAIKKAPVYKMPLLVVATTPLIFTVMPSSNYDSFIFAFFIIAMAYFIYMIKNTVENKDLFIFLLCCLLIGLIKPQYSIICLLVFFIPKENFKFSKPRTKLLIAVIVLFIIGYFILKVMNMTTQARYGVSLSSNVSMEGQLQYLLHHPFVIWAIIKRSIFFIYDYIIVNNFYFHDYWVREFSGIALYNELYFVFFMFMSIFYPIKIKFSKYKRLLLFLFMVVFYLGIFFSIYMAWNPVGYPGLYGVQARYFVPLFALVPLVISYPVMKLKDMDSYIITGILIFMAGMLMLVITHFY